MAIKCVYDQAKDKNIATYVVDGKASDNKLYYDLTATEPVQVTQEDLQDAFLKGRLLVKVTADSVDTYYAVTSVSANTAKTVDVESSTVTVTEWTAKAAE